MSISKIVLCVIVVAAAAFGQTSGTPTGTLTVNHTATSLSFAQALQTTDWTLGPVRVFDFGNRAWVEGTSKRPGERGGAPTDVTYRIRTVRVGTDWMVQPM